MMGRKFAARLLFLCVMILFPACNLGISSPSITATSTPETAFTATSTSESLVNPAEPTSTQEEASTNTPTNTQEPTPTDTETPAASPEPITYPVGPDSFPKHVDPLTGLPVGNPAILNRRPLAIKVSNFPRSARPQAGLTQTDLLFEWYTEQGSTRFVAMYFGQDSQKVGPIRSVRAQDFSIIPLFDAILVHVAGYGPVIEEMNKRGIDAIGEFGAGGAAIWRDPAVENQVNSVFANTLELTKYAKKVGMDNGQPNLNGMAFNTSVPDGGRESKGLRIDFSQGAIGMWTYDPNTGRYLRTSENDSNVLVPLKDQNSGAQLAMDNLIVIVTKWLPSELNMEGGKRLSSEMWEFLFTGKVNNDNDHKAYFFRDGMAYEGAWQSWGPDVPLRFVDKNGGTFYLKPGSTYIAVIRLQDHGHICGGRLSSTIYQFYGNPNVHC